MAKIIMRSEKLNSPPKEIIDERNFELIILWLLNNNSRLKWRNFIDEGINQSTLSNKLNQLILKDYVEKFTTDSMREENPIII